jgi:galactokinase
MDQFVSLFGRKNTALFLDCEDLSFKHIPVTLDKDALCLLVYDTGVKRKLVSSEYNLRRKESSEALSHLRSSSSKLYKDLTLEDLMEKREGLTNTLFKRAHHVISENQRVKKAVQALAEEDFTALGDILFRSHESLKNDYDVSCPELDLLYEIGKTSPGCMGARMTGAGFGGSGIALLKIRHLDDFKKKMLEAAAEKGYCIPMFHEVKIDDGAVVYRLH